MEKTNIRNEKEQKDFAKYEQAYLKRKAKLKAFHKSNNKKLKIVGKDFNLDRK